MTLRQPVLIGIAVGALVLVIGAAIAFYFLRPKPTEATTRAASPASVKLEVSDEPAVPAVWVDVYSPAALRKAVKGNAWFKEALEAPIGQGFLGSWSGFLGTRGSDAALDFEGPLADFLVERVFDRPFRVMFFAGSGATSTPALIVPALSSSAREAAKLLDRGTSSGSVEAPECPGEGGALVGGVTISRWQLADHAVYAYVDEQQLVLARHPLAVLHALCAPGEALSAKKNVDVAVSFAAPQLGREVQTLAVALGLGATVSLGMGVEGDRLVPRGVIADVLVKDRLGKAGLSAEALKLLPADTSLVLSLQIPLPVPLDAAALETYWKGGSTATREVRPVILAWQPRGDANLPPEWSLVWGRAADLPALTALFSDGSFPTAELCGQAVIASNVATLDRLRSTCAGKSPSLMNVAAPVVQGLRAETSIGIGVNLGALLSQLLLDGFASEHGKSLATAPPPEIEEARRHLQSLPFLGFHGTAEGTTLVPGGFGS